MEISGRNKELVKPYLQLFSNFKTLEEKQIYDEIVANPSSGLVYMLDSDLLYLIQNGSITDKIIIVEEEEEETEDLF
jgi:hypothetical protein